MITQLFGRPVRPDTLREAFGCFPTGVTAICALAEGRPVGMAASSFTSVSLRPPLVSTCMAKSSSTWPALRELPRVGVSVLAASQHHAGRALAAKTGDRFAAVDWRASGEGAVFVEGAACWLDCSVHDAVSAGDHHIVLFEVRAIEVFPEVAPLVFHSSQFRELKTLAWDVIGMRRLVKAAAPVVAGREPAKTASTGTAPAQVQETVAEIIAAVRDRGDDAVREYSERFDRWSPESFRLDRDRIQAIVSGVPSGVLDDIRTVQANVRAFARRQRESLTDFEVETAPGVRLGQRSIPVAACGAYIPGGRYPLVASAHMTIVTAKVAGVARVVACTPPIRGEIPAATVAAAHVAGADEIHLLGGVQAIAAMALGTPAIPRVDLLAGPGNAYVAEAKRQLYGEVGIDLLAGPTEILVIADGHADPFVVAVDLLSQAEHGPDSPAILITTSEALGRRVLEHLERLLEDLPTRDFAGPAWRDHGQIIVVDDLPAAYALADEFACEHVQVLTRTPREALDHMRNYGAMFLGEGTCVSYGDKVIGTNHVLPTRRNARFTGGLWVGMYLKTVTYQEVTDPASSAALGELCGRAARVELFEGHARSGDVRAAKHNGTAPPWAPWAADGRAHAPR